MTSGTERHTDPLSTLREYRNLAPWNLRDLATLAGAILESSGVRPINAAASQRPSERTIRFYVTRGLVTPPEGRGTAATYAYRHLLQVLGIKLRQMEGATLSTITDELAHTTGDVLERRVAAALGPSLPLPTLLPLTSDDRPAWGRAGRALRTWINQETRAPAEGGPDGVSPSSWRRLPISRGIELHLSENHPLARYGNRHGEIVDAVRLALTRVLGQRQEPDAPDSGDGGSERRVP